MYTLDTQSREVSRTVLPQKDLFCISDKGWWNQKTVRCVFEFRWLFMYGHIGLWGAWVHLYFLGLAVPICYGEVCCVWTQRTQLTLREELSSFLGESLKIASVYRGSATMRQCWGQRWASLLFLFHLWSKHFTLRHTPMYSLTPKLHPNDWVIEACHLHSWQVKWQKCCLKEVEAFMFFNLFHFIFCFHNIQ